MKSIEDTLAEINERIEWFVQHRAKMREINSECTLELSRGAMDELMDLRLWIMEAG